MHEALNPLDTRPTQPASLALAGPCGRAWSRLLARLLRLPVDATRVAARGFQVPEPAMVQHIERIGGSFSVGYTHALGATDLNALADALALHPVADRGFAFEGAGMALALTDWMTPRRRWFAAFLDGPARSHAYMAWVGFGWALARLPVRAPLALDGFPTLFKWLALDGYGFHAGYFDWPHTVLRQRRPRGWASDPLRIFDQGLGRSLWFVYGARPAAIGAAIDAFAPARRADLWSGVGLAAAYAGGVGTAELDALHTGAGPHASALAQGAVFAAEARIRAGNPVPHLALACQRWLGTEPEPAACMAMQWLPRDGTDAAAYQRWRLAVQCACAARMRSAGIGLPGASASRSRRCR